MYWELRKGEFTKLRDCLRAAIKLQSIDAPPTGYARAIEVDDVTVRAVGVSEKSNTDAKVDQLTNMVAGLSQSVAKITDMCLMEKSSTKPGLDNNQYKGGQCLCSEPGKLCSFQ